LYIANVGDSTGILCSSFGTLSQSDLVYVQDAAVPEEKSRPNRNKALADASAQDGSSEKTGADTSEGN
jgi:serine/threonine protein phosphatase PrpC